MRSIETACKHYNSEYNHAIVNITIIMSVTLRSKHNRYII